MAVVSPYVDAPNLIRFISRPDIFAVPQTRRPVSKRVAALPSRQSCGKADVPLGSGVCGAVQRGVFGCNGEVQRQHGEHRMLGDGAGPDGIPDLEAADCMRCGYGDLPSHFPTILRLNFNAKIEYSSLI